MRHFKTEAGALEYAENLKKSEKEVAMIGGIKYLLSSTTIPEEEIIREPLEVMIQEFLEFMEYDEDKIEDTVAYLGAQLTEIVKDKITEEAGIEFLSAGQCY